jgi:SAM-dependent methyltransferase
LRLGEQRRAFIVEVLAGLSPPPRRIVEVGCAEGRLLLELAGALPGTPALLGLDPSPIALRAAARRLAEAEQDPGWAGRGKVTLAQGSLAYRDDRLRGADAILLVEVVEHLDPEQVDTLIGRALEARPRLLVLTTPNRETNTALGVPPGELRRRDHRFEWDRRCFRDWAEKLARRYGYTPSISGLGPLLEGCGHPTQTALLRATAE